MNMANPSSRDADGSSAPSSSTALLLISTVADTTWRLFLPAIGGTVLGLWIGNVFDVQPWTTILGVIVGCVVSFRLVYTQIRKVKS
jgi:F0F1-type ATP synthase assembly protein I